MASAEKIIIVTIGVDQFAITVDFVSSIETAQNRADYTEIRGEHIEVVKLQSLMKSSAVDDSIAAGKIVVVQSNGRKAGLYVDETSTVRELQGAVHPIPPELGLERGSLVSGVVQLEEQLMIMLDIPGILTEIEEMRIV